MLRDCGQRRLFAEKRKRLQDLPRVHDLPWHELRNGESDYLDRPANVVEDPLHLNTRAE